MALSPSEVSPLSISYTPQVPPPDLQVFPKQELATLESREYYLCIIFWKMLILGFLLNVPLRHYTNIAREALKSHAHNRGLWVIKYWHQIPSARHRLNLTSSLIILFPLYCQRSPMPSWITMRDISTFSHDSWFFPVVPIYRHQASACFDQPCQRSFPPSHLYIFHLSLS